MSRLGLFNNSIPNEVTLLNKRPFVVSKFSLMCVYIYIIFVIVIDFVSKLSLPYRHSGTV